MTITIVVVDDDEVDRYIARRAVKGAQFEGTVIEYNSGDEFLAVLYDDAQRRKEIGEPPPPVLVLLDINMPRKDGFEVLESIKQTWGGEENPYCMIFMMFTSSDHANDKAEAFSYSFVKDYIVKPITKEKIEKAVAELYR